MYLRSLHSTLVRRLAARPLALLFRRSPTHDPVADIRHSDWERSSEGRPPLLRTRPGVTTIGGRPACLRGYSRRVTLLAKCFSGLTEGSRRSRSGRPATGRGQRRVRSRWAVMEGSAAERHRPPATRRNLALSSLAGGRLGAWPSRLGWMPMYRNEVKVRSFTESRDIHVG